MKQTTWLTLTLHLVLALLVNPAAADENTKTQLIKKKCITSEILEVCYNDLCTQAPCSNNNQCKTVNESPNSATCLDSDTRTASIVGDKSINPPIANPSELSL